MKNWIGILVLLACSIVSCNDDGGDNEGTTTLTLNFASSFNNTPLVLSNTYTYNDEFDISINAARFFVSDITLVKSNGERVAIEEVGVVDLTQTHTPTGDKKEVITIENVATGDYTGIEFGIGVDSVLNSAIPPDFDNAHPLSAASEYWDWRATYIFSKLEGRVIKTTGEETFFVYHSGTNDLYRKVTCQKNISLNKDQAADLNFTLDAKNWFIQNGGLLDIETNRMSHSAPSNIWLADLIITNIANSIQIQE